MSILLDDPAHPDILHGTPIRMTDAIKAVEMGLARWAEPPEVSDVYLWTTDGRTADSVLRAVRQPGGQSTLF